MKPIVGPFRPTGAIPRGLLLALAGGLALLRGGAEAAAAEDPPPVLPRSQDKFVLQPGAHGMSTIERGELTLFLVEGVYLARGPFSIEARNLVIWGDPERMKEEEGPLGRLSRRSAGDETAPDAPAEKEGEAAVPEPEAPGGQAWSKLVPDQLREVLGPVIHSIYAEGEVRFTLGTRTLRADRLFVDFRRSILVTGRVQTTFGMGIQSRNRTIPLVVRAERLRQTAVNELTMEDAVYSTCEFAEPHYSFRCKELVLTEHDDHQTFTSYRNVLWVEGIPIFYLPVFGGRSDLNARPLRAATFEQSSRFGRFFSLLWSDDVVIGGEKWGEWRLRTDMRSKRGPGVGPELEYGRPGFKGELLTYWQKDNEETDKFNDSPVPRDERGRVRWEHRHRLGEDTRLDFSLYEFSDRNFQPEYLEKEFLEGRDPETYATLRWQNRHDTASLSGKFHNDDFRTETTEEPEGILRRTGAPATAAWTRFLPLDQLTYSMDFRAGAYQRRFDEDLGVGGDRIVRQDAVFRAEGVKWVGPIALSPLVTAGATARQGEETPGAEPDTTRADLAWGVRAKLEARGDFNSAKSRLFLLDGLRHLVSLEGLGYDRWTVTEEPAGASAFDRVDLLDEVKVGVVRFRNRLQTMRGGRRVDWIDLELRGLWFPDGLEGQTSPLRFKEEGLEEARFQDFLGEEKYRSVPQSGRAGASEGDLRVRLRENLYLIGEGEYEPDLDALRTAAAGVRWFQVPTFSVYAGNRRIKGDSNIWTVTADTYVSDRWAVRFVQQTDFLNDDGLKSEVRLRRVLHDFVFEFGVEVDHTTDDTTISLALVPSALWDPPASAERLGKLDFEAQRWYR